MNQYKHLTQEQRYHIYQCLKQGMTQSFIADNIGVNKSTISREINRNTGKRSYRYKQAHMLACNRQSMPKYQKWNLNIQQIVNSKLRLQWSPEQISGHLRVNENIEISHERIYQHILQDKKENGNLWTHLRRAHKKRKKRYGKADRRGIIPNKVMIAERPSVVDNKSRVGDFELDTIIGKGHKGAVVTIVDRKSKLLLARPVKRRTAALVSDAIIQLLKPYIKHTHTLTPDNGKEFSYHQKIAEQLDTKVYFANPYSSWERGLNEHTNGLLRQYLPKQMAFDNLSEQQVNKAVALLNSRPRKSLNYQTPQAVFKSGIIQQQEVALRI
jgi:IS30 family transposase